MRKKIASDLRLNTASNYLPYTGKIRAKLLLRPF